MLDCTNWGCGTLKKTMLYDHNHDCGGPAPGICLKTCAGEPFAMCIKHFDHTQGPDHAWTNASGSLKTQCVCLSVFKGLPSHPSAKLVACWESRSPKLDRGATCTAVPPAHQQCVCCHALSNPWNDSEPAQQPVTHPPPIPLFAKCITCHMFMRLPSPACMLSCTSRASSLAPCDAQYHSKCPRGSRH